MQHLLHDVCSLLGFSFLFLVVIKYALDVLWQMIKSYIYFDVKLLKHHTFTFHLTSLLDIHFLIGQYLYFYRSINVFMVIIFFMLNMDLNFIFISSTSRLILPILSSRGLNLYVSKCARFMICKHWIINPNCV